MSLLDIPAGEYVVLEEVGAVQLPRVGTAVRVRVMDTEHGPGRRCARMLDRGSLDEG